MMSDERRDWLEGQASDQLERERWERGGFSVRIPDGRELLFYTPYDTVIAAHAILSEAEIAMRSPSQLLDDHHDVVGVSNFDDDMSEATLTEKGNRVGVAIVNYGLAYENRMGEPWESWLSDMIADIGHFYCNLPADQREWDDPEEGFAHILELASRHVADERVECDP